MTTVLLVNPEFQSVWGPRVPPSLAYLGAVLIENGLRVEIVDLNLDRPNTLLKHLKRRDLAIVGVTCISATYNAAVDIARQVKKVSPSIITVLGGLHVSHFAEETLQQNPDVDIVVKGEGEFTLLEIVNAIDENSELDNITGLAFKEGNSIITTPDRPLVKDLDELPLPAYNLFAMRRYYEKSLPPGVTVMSSSRGCIYHCTFCSMSSLFNYTWRARSPKKVVDEMEILICDHGFRQIDFGDELFTLDEDRVVGICEEIIQRGLHHKARWQCEARVDTLSKNLLRKMKQAGCYCVCLGIESGCQDILDACKKGITIEEAENAVRYAKEVGMETIGSFIIGLPGETKETALQTIRLAKELGCERVIFHNLIPYPGSKIYNDPKRFGITIRNADFSKYDFFLPVAETEKLDFRTLGEIWLQILSDPYFEGKSLRVSKRHRE